MPGSPPHPGNGADGCGCPWDLSKDGATGCAGHRAGTRTSLTISLLMSLRGTLPPDYRPSQAQGHMRPSLASGSREARRQVPSGQQLGLCIPHHGSLEITTGQQAFVGEKK
jgi:hypothetical protein